MSARKLQQEIDKVNKKISEGLAIFDDTYEKLFATELSLQRDKFEADLKKEIKKLQRLRDQVKQWLGDGSIKLDKKVLQDNRSKIEHAMDQFKDLEKLSKIKQFSNEGLELSKKSGKLRGFGDANDEKKQAAVDYISDAIEKLSTQNESLETEIATLTLQLKKAKLAASIAIQNELDEAREKHAQLRNHLDKLENVLRSLENEILKADAIDSIKEDLDYIVESNQDEDFIDYDDFYEVLNLKEIEFNNFNKEEQERRDREEKEEKEKEERKEKDQEDKKKKKPIAAAVTTPVTVPVGTPLPVSTTYSGVIKSALTATPSPKPAAATPVPESGLSMAEAIAAAAAATSAVSNATVANAAAASAANMAAVSAAVLHTAETPTKLNGNNLSKVSTLRSSTSSPVLQDIPVPLPQSEQAQLYDTKTFIESIPTLLLLSQTRLANPLPFKSISTLLENSLYNCPDSFDAERPRQYTPRNVHPSSIDYPQEPMFELNSHSIMRKFNDDTLFYCFYYSDATYNLLRINAARELTSRGWFFNKETHQWFSHDNKTADLKYFDYQETWLVRRRDAKVAPDAIQAFV